MSDVNDYSTLYIHAQVFSNNAVLPQMIKTQQNEKQRGKKKHIGKVIHVDSFIFRETILNHCQYIFKSSVINTQGAQQVHAWHGYNLWSKPCFGLSQHSLRLKLRRTEGTLTKLDMLQIKNAWIGLYGLQNTHYLIWSSKLCEVEKGSDYCALKKKITHTDLGSLFNSRSN